MSECSTTGYIRAFPAARNESWIVFRNLKVQVQERENFPPGWPSGGQHAAGLRPPGRRGRCSDSAARGRRSFKRRRIPNECCSSPIDENLVVDRPRGGISCTHCPRDYHCSGERILFDQQQAVGSFLGPRGSVRRFSPDTVRNTRVAS